MIGALSIVWSPLIPWALIALLGGAALLLLVFALWRRATGALWRGAALALLLLALANPSVVREEREPLSDIALLVVDESPSQAVEPRETQAQAAARHLLLALERLPDSEVRVIRAGRGAFGVDRQGTRLFSAVREALASVPRQRIGALFMISDGQVHDVPQSLAGFGLEAPLHLLLTGSEGEGDRRLEITKAPSFGIVGRELSLSFRVDDLIGSGAARSGGSAVVTVRQDGGAPEQVTVPVGEEQELLFELQHRGATPIELEVESGPQELTLANNRAAVMLQGVRDRLRVLLVSGEPHAGERAWRNILKSDPSVDLVHFTILRPPEKQDGTPIRELSLIAFPTRELFEVKLHEFDLIIFDRYRRRGVLPSIYLDNIARYVENGGALLEAVGPTFATPLSLYRTPLGRVLPGEPTGHIFERGYRPAITELGERHPVTAELPGAPEAAGREPDWGRWFRHIDAEARDGTVVMRGVESRPLLILSRYGDGRVAQFMSDHMWLWARGFEGGGPQAELLRRIAHWLMKEPDLEEEDLRATVESGRLEIVRRSLEARLPEVEVILPSGRRETLSLEAGNAGRAVAHLPAEEAGLYRISDGERTALAAAGPPNPLEMADLRATAALLEPLIEESGGGVARVASESLPSLRKVKPGRDRHGRGWLGVEAKGRYVVTGVAQTPLLPAILLLALALGTMVMAWYREGR